ncbi:MAG: thioredoxin domain-containing protein [Coriobacteriia bacterium]|nr:thioredoxin domain-containing protein [Coriobacteriia bacterium]
MPDPRLADSASPYLRQHAGDPVEWYQWGDEAFQTARDLGRPIFLSIGYSACHWCHVMQRESFRDPETAALLNERFVSVKVDRELRPDVDAFYMDYVVATTGAGGWPMSVFLTPDLVPLLGGTYFPKEPRGSAPSFRDVLGAVDVAYSTGGDALTDATEGTLRFLRDQAAPKPPGEFDREALDCAAEYLLRLTDVAHGGFGDSPKFPQLAALSFLADYRVLNPDPDVDWVVEHTLTHILRGGVTDQAGGGLHRYTVDAAWRTPHFEKMLTDQGLLLSVLAAAAPIASDETVRSEYAHAARRTAEFLASEMAAPCGGFFAALSADTDGIEGATYVWSRAQLAAFLPRETYEFATTMLGADAEEEPFTLTRSSGRADRTEALDAALDAIKAERDKRPQPDADTKVITSWNAIAARGLMEAGATFSDEQLVTLGLSTLSAVLDRALTPTGLLHVPDDPSITSVRLIEDAAHLAAACLTAFDATGGPVWLDRAVHLHADTLETFWDGDLLYMTPVTTELPVRPREQSDQPVPSGASTAIENAVRLAAATGDASYAEWAHTALRQFWAIADFAPEQVGRALAAGVRLQLL